MEDVDRLVEVMQLERPLKDVLLNGITEYIEMQGGIQRSVHIAYDDPNVRVASWRPTRTWRQCPPSTFKNRKYLIKWLMTDHVVIDYLDHKEKSFMHLESYMISEANIKLSYDSLPISVLRGIFWGFYGDRVDSIY